MLPFSDLILAATCPIGVSSTHEYMGRLCGASSNPTQEVLRLLRNWNDVESALAMSRAYSVLNHWKYTLRWGPDSMGFQMMLSLERALPGRTLSWVRLHALGFSGLRLAYDVYLRTVKTFIKEKNINMDPALKAMAMQIYLMSIYQLGRPRHLSSGAQQLILFGAHDSLNTFFNYPQGLDFTGMGEWVGLFEKTVSQGFAPAANGRRLSPPFALVRSVFNQLGLSSQRDRIVCSTLLESGAQHVLELSEDFVLPARVSALA